MSVIELKRMLTKINLLYFLQNIYVQQFIIAHIFIDPIKFWGRQSLDFSESLIVREQLFSPS